MRRLMHDLAIRVCNSYQRASLRRRTSRRIETQRDLRLWSRILSARDGNVQRLDRNRRRIHQLHVAIHSAIEREVREVGRNRIHAPRVVTQYSEWHTALVRGRLRQRVREIDDELVIPTLMLNQ